MRRVFAFAVFAAVVLVATPAAAHDPLFFTDEQTTPETGPFLPDGTISFALYGTLDGAGDTRGFQVAFQDGDALYVELLIPDKAPENGFADADLPVATVTAPDGATYDLVPAFRQPFDEPFSGTRYLSLSTHEGTAAAGVYDVVITGQEPARFTIAVGTTESFFTPVERVPNRIDSFLGIAAPLAEWYEGAAPASVEAPPATAATTPDPPATAAAPQVTAMAPETSAPNVTDGAEVAEEATAPTDGRSGFPVVVIVVVAAVFALAALGAITIARRRARP